jgi:crotonobetainyl-CoA:carnitine CoA-transferase CaiB-like acyl-CoA transferase
MPSASAAVIQAIVFTNLILTIRIKIDVNFIKFKLCIETVAAVTGFLYGGSMSDSSMKFLRAASMALQFPADALMHITVQGSGELTSAFPVADFAAEAIATAGVAVAQLLKVQSDCAPEVVVDRRLASLWFGWSIHPVGWTLPAAWDSIAGDYATRDGWIRLHTNAPHHKAAALAVLQCADDKSAVAGVVANWDAEELETAIVERKGCAAAMRTCNEWKFHPQGKAVASEPLIALSSIAASFGPSAWQPEEAGPLAGLKVLDLTRVLAGPVATRFLAGYGADVLRIDPPGWNEPALIPEVTLGKRCARLDLETQQGREIFEQLLLQADVLVHGYRPGALDQLGYTESARRAINPGLIDVSLDAYGWSGPWQGRRGFDSLVQMSSGIAHAGMQYKQADRPVPLPVQALDQATGYLMAAAVVRSLIWRITENRATTARLSLARTAQSLIDVPRTASAAEGLAASSSDFSALLEQTEWGPAKRCRSPVSVGGAALAWRRPASILGSAEPRW